MQVSDILIDEWTQAQCIGVIVEKIKKPGIGAVLCPVRFLAVKTFLSTLVNPAGQ